MNIGVYLGSFNPVHKGHMKIVEETLKQQLVDKVLIVATGTYWDKNNLVDINHRINMLKIFENETIKIETELNLVKYAYDCFNLLQKRYIDDNLFLILGADNLVKFEDWFEYKKMLVYPFIIVKRDEYDADFINNRMNDFNKDNYYILDIPNINDSSTTIRNDIRNNVYNSAYLDQRVYEYIVNNRLYLE